MLTRRTVLRLAPALLLAFGLTGPGLAGAAPPDKPRGFDRALAAKAAHEEQLLARSDVVGTAVGLAADGSAVVKVYTKHGGGRDLPATLDGVPVEVEETGEIVAHLQGIDVSTGPEELIVYRRKQYCVSGTLGARVSDTTGRSFALSNAHVYARQGSTPATPVSPADRVLQPGRADMPGCGTQVRIDQAYIGTLVAWSTLDFSKKGSNTVDAAIALFDPAKPVPNASVDGTGGSSALTAATLGLLVQKFGRTTELTTGHVSGLGATILVSYDVGTARFVNQIVVTGNGSLFSGSGDSGSMIVTSDASKNPVALLFAGGGNTTIGNPIGLVLDAFKAMGFTLTIAPGEP